MLQYLVFTLAYRACSRLLYPLGHVLPLSITTLRHPSTRTLPSCSRTYNHRMHPLLILSPPGSLRGIQQSQLPTFSCHSSAPKRTMRSITTSVTVVIALNQWSTSQSARIRPVLRIRCGLSQLGSFGLSPLPCSSLSLNIENDVRRTAPKCRL